MCKTRYFWASYIIHRLYNYAKSAIYSGLREGVLINLAMFIIFFCRIKLMGTTTLTPQPWKLLVTVTSQLE